MAQMGAHTSETQSLLKNRVSVRSYSEEPVEGELIEAILEAAFRAPTSSNIQAYSVIVVRDPEALMALSTATNNQKHVANAPVFLAFCADITRIQAAMEKNHKSVKDNNLELGLVSSIDASLVGMSASLVAESFGLKGVMIGAVRNDPVEVAQILGLPDQVYCVFGMCLGWPGTVPAQKPRMEQNAIVHYERYGNHAGDRSEAEMLNKYDADLSAHYSTIGKTTTNDSWTHEIAKKFSPQPRSGLREALKGLGFNFE